MWHDTFSLIVTAVGTSAILCSSADPCSQHPIGKIRVGNTRLANAKPKEQDNTPAKMLLL